MLGGAERFESRPQTARVFFALQPARSVQSALHALANKAAGGQSGRCVKAENIHLTLVFLGEVETEQIATLRAIAADVAAGMHKAASMNEQPLPPFSLTIQGTRFWKKNRIVMASVVQYPPVLFALADAIKTALMSAGFSCEARPFKPHITLIRKAGAHTPLTLEQPIQWDVDDWLLMQSRLSAESAHYTELGRWPLAAHASEPGAARH